ncbi:MAG: ribosome-associated protein [Sphingomonadales bacterium]|jgi:ribosome-associated protein|nr:ribosome-associated protein [Sphingomonadales bacterium]
MAMSFEIPDDALEEMRRFNSPRELKSRLGDATTFSFLAASGPGGQNVNKVATACQLRCDLFKLGLAPEVYARLKLLAGSRMTSGGEIVITARKYRTQEANREDARARLAELVAKAHVEQAKRKRTRPSRAAKAKRVDAKKQRGSVKQRRGKVSLD